MPDTPSPCNPQAQREAVRHLNEDPINMIGGPVSISEEKRAQSRRERLRLYRELFPEKYP